MGEPVFGDELRRQREQRGLSLKKFARLVHYDPGYLSRSKTVSSRRQERWPRHVTRRWVAV
ncbi:MAG: helix-turn-helix domain-containing protein [Pseudonocardiaceae bacterium]